jgi:cation diffusion facilitator family transporter
MTDTHTALEAKATRLRLVAALTSVVAGTAILVAKVVAWQLTGSSAVLSDALESVVNVVAAGFALNAVHVASQPADQEHPYGHGKMELLSAAFEGGLITFAAALIFYEGIQALRGPVEVRSLDVGLGVSVAAALANLALGGFLLRQGKQVQSPTLIADGKHVLSDVWTTVGVIIGLGLVKLTGLTWLDPVTAIAVGLLLARTGVHLVREAAEGLLDHDDPVLLQQIVDAFNAHAVAGLGGVHRLRVLRHGHQIHVDGHVHVPQDWTVKQAHDAVETLERQMQEQLGAAIELAFHLDPWPADKALPPGPLTLELATRLVEVLEPVK